MKANSSQNHSDKNTIIMKRIPLIFLLLPALILLFNACKTDFDVTSDYKEIAIVYGVLNQKDNVHYLRVNKAFLGQGNAVIYSQIPDSSSYGNDIEVFINELKGTQLIRKISFDTVTIHDKDTGFFYFPDQLMYKASATLDSSMNYEMKVVNKKTGYEVSSITNLISGIRIVKPISGSKFIDFKRSLTNTQSFEWESAKNGRRYQPTLRFYFFEVGQNYDTTSRYIDWELSAYKTERLTGGEKMFFYYQNEEFFRLCETKIPYTDTEKENNLGRVVDHFELFLTAVGDEYSTYLDVNGPSTGLLLEKPNYSNINNGIGMFSCRYTWVKSYKVGENAKTDLQSKTNLHFVVN